jgi:catechol 2,3-dioxygenase-like lactoylglutathione lyase family enzyme
VPEHVLVKARLTDATPVLASLDFDETIDFYGKLGFSLRVRTPDLLILQRDGISIQFWACTERHVAENTQAYLHTADADALYAEFAKGVHKGLRAPETRPWGIREFTLVDGHGNQLRIGQFPRVQ